MATVAPSCWSRWSAKQYIVGALLGLLVAIAVAAAISISFAPAHISFSVSATNVTTVTVDEQSHIYDQFFNFTLVANNTSRRTSVSYGSLSAEMWYSETAWIPAELDTTAQQQLLADVWWRPGSTAAVAAWAEWGQYNEEPPTKRSNMTTTTTDMAPAVVVKWPFCRVVVKARVWFRYGLLPTRPYTIRVSCFPVIWIFRNVTAANQTRPPAIINCIG